MDDGRIGELVGILQENLARWSVPIVTYMAEERHDPFRVLIATVLSLRTKDDVTARATEHLFALAVTPEEMAALPAEAIRQAIYPVGFYRTKADRIIAICRDLIERFHSRVPDSIEELLTLKGVGRKTANLVVSLGYDGDGICVDTHVHRISNRLGYVTTRTPGETEQALREKLPREHWRVYNTLMVAFGQQVCRPISPFCSRCPVFHLCDRVGVMRSR
jgi:endonuclease III